MRSKPFPKDKPDKAECQEEDDNREGAQGRVQGTHHRIVPVTDSNGGGGPEAFCRLMKMICTCLSSDPAFAIVYLVCFFPSSDGWNFLSLSSTLKRDYTAKSGL